eukprot:878750-Pyramimonas_sp.AAC.1
MSRPARHVAGPRPPPAEGYPTTFAPRPRSIFWNSKISCFVWSLALVSGITWMIRPRISSGSA